VHRLWRRPAVPHPWLMAMTTPQPPGLNAHAQALRMDTATLIVGLRALLGTKLVAYLGGALNAGAVGEWAKGTRTVQNAADEHCLRVAYEAAVLLVERDSPETAQAWFQGLNPELGDHSPARQLRGGDPEDVDCRVLSAARAFAAVCRLRAVVVAAFVGPLELIRNAHADPFFATNISAQLAKV